MLPAAAPHIGSHIWGAQPPTLGLAEPAGPAAGPHATSLGHHQHSHTHHSHHRTAQPLCPHPGLFNCLCTPSCLMPSVWHWALTPAHSLLSQELAASPWHSNTCERLRSHREMTERGFNRDRTGCGDQVQASDKRTDWQLFTCDQPLPISLFYLFPIMLTSAPFPYRPPYQLTQSHWPPLTSLTLMSASLSTAKSYFMCSFLPIHQLVWVTKLVSCSCLC